MIQNSSSSFGQSYLIPIGDGRLIPALVAHGHDLAVFDQTVYDRAESKAWDADVLFRVHFGRESPRRHFWHKAGLKALRPSLQVAQPYFYQAIGDERCYLVRYGLPDLHIDCSRSSEFEALATWSHEHIIARFKLTATCK
jgi:hypothetical protein